MTEETKIGAAEETKIPTLKFSNVGIVVAAVNLTSAFLSLIRPIAFVFLTFIASIWNLVVATAISVCIALIAGVAFLLMIAMTPFGLTCNFFDGLDYTIDKHKGRMGIFGRFV